MRKIFVYSVLLLGGAAWAFAAEPMVSFDAQRSRVYNATAGGRLTTPSQAAPAAVAAGFLRAQHRDARLAGSLVTVAQSARRPSGIVHVRLAQEVQGLRVHGAYAKAAVNSRGELVHMIDNLVTVPRGGVSPAAIRELEALQTALRTLYPAVEQRFAAARPRGRNGLEFPGSEFFSRNPVVTRVAVPLRDGSLQAGFVVETWSRKGNLLHYTVVGGDGRVLSSELRTNSDSYNVFTEDPDKTPQAVVAGPGTGTGAWLFPSSQTTRNIAGNNANAYLDTDANNAADGGGTAVTDGNFLTTANLAQPPSTADNRNVAVQNLFFLNNVIHDKLYGHGFDEAAGNFQEDNFGLGGAGSDSVLAEAQDGSGTDNANFATPVDGSNPRMQMYLWTPTGTNELTVNSPLSIAGTYAAAGAAFGPALTVAGTTGNVVLASPIDGCARITNKAAITGNIAFVDRGTCDFTKKVLNAQSAGAIAVIVANNVAGGVFTMGGSSSRITIPAEMISQSDGVTIRTTPGVNATLRLVNPPPPQHDSTVDADIVYHEYGHGLTWRMIGSMSGPMSGAIGEGMSDVLAVLLNGDDVVAEYSASSPLGIRSAPYTNYPRTYGDVAGTGVHFDGEVYGAIGWRLGELYLADGQTIDTLLDDLVGGMNFTPAGPKFEDMRDGILAQAAGSGRECLVWEAFADYGVGVGAQATVRGTKVVVSESFTLPASCP